MFTSKYAEKCIYFVLSAPTLYYEHLALTVLFSESSQSKDSIGTMPKPNDTGWAI